MTTSNDKVTDYIATAIGGSLIGQIARQRSISIEELLDRDNPKLRALGDELAVLGIDPHLLANHVTAAFTALFVEESNADHIITTFTQLLWTVLGDPENGGKPPEIYRRAGVAMHLMLLSLIDPSITNKACND